MEFKRKNESNILELSQESNQALNKSNVLRVGMLEIGSFIFHLDDISWLFQSETIQTEH
jgi:hypothetical protein